MLSYNEFDALGVLDALENSAGLSALPVVASPASASASATPVLLVPLFRPFRVIGRDLPTREEPCTCQERETALAAYAEWIETARGWLAEARNSWRTEYARRCAAEVARLESERAVWLASEAFLSPNPSRQVCPFRGVAVFAVVPAGM